eukprot:7346298-Prymnesium_polylepis.3
MGAVSGMVKSGSGGTCPSPHADDAIKLDELPDQHLVEVQLLQVALAHQRRPHLEDPVKVDGE